MDSVRHTAMTLVRPRVAVIGAGAIGCVTAGFPSHEGHDVENVCKHKNTVGRCSLHTRCEFYRGRSIWAEKRSCSACGVTFDAAGAVNPATREALIN